MKKLDDCINLIIKNKGIAVFDFDWTITTQESNSSIGVFTNYLPKSYINKKKVLDYFTNKAKGYIFYKIIWYMKLHLLSRYYDKTLVESIDYVNEFKLNDKCIKIIDKFRKNNIHIIIYSSGMYEIIRKVLSTYNIDLNGIDIISNDINYETKIIKKNIISPKKDKLDLNNNYVILFGDKNDDLMIANNSIKVLVRNNKFEVLYE